MLWGISATDWLTILGAILNLMILEGLLSADNALVLAVMVRHLPKPQQKRALRFGIWGAFIFRLIAVIFASLLLEFWWLKVAGGLYLLMLAVRHFLSGSHEADVDRPARWGGGFWATVLNVELADIAFSIDSILAAVALADALPPQVANLSITTAVLPPFPMKLAIVYVGGVLGIVAMRLVAGVFLVVLEKFPGLVNGAYILVAWIGVKLVESGVHQRFPQHVLEMPDWVFWAGMGLIIVASLIYRPKRPPTPPHTDIAGPATQEPSQEPSPATDH